MPVEIVHFGTREAATIEEVLDGGRTLVVAGARYTLRPLTGRHVREGEPYYGVRVVLCHPDTP